MFFVPGRHNQARRKIVLRGAQGAAAATRLLEFKHHRPQKAPRMELEALEIFVDIAEQGNFSRVARRRNLAVSSVTRRIDQLEQDFGMPLLHRSPRGLQLTDAGQRLLAGARRVVAEMADARDAMQDAGGAQGTLVVAAPATFGRRHVAPAIASFLRQYPALEVELHISDEMQDLARCRIDVAVRIGVSEDSDLLAVTLAPQRRVAVASAAYLERHDRPQSPADLLAHNCLTHGDIARRAGWWVFAGVNQGKPLPVRGSLRSDDSESLLQAALAGVGVAHLATWLVAGEIARGALVPLFPDELRQAPAPDSRIYALRMPGRAVARSKLLIAHLQRSFSPKGDGAPYWEPAFHT